MNGLDEQRGSRGLSPRHLVLIFLAGVAVCGVFFSLGFLVGFNERFSRSTPATERVGSPSAAPPLVNPETVPISSQDASAVHPPVNLPTEAAPSPASGTAAAPQGAKSRDSKAPSPPSPAPQPASGAAKRETERAAASTAAEVGEGVTLQVAAMRARQDADALFNVLKGRGYPVFIVTPEYARADDNLYRVQVGPFRTREEAEKARSKLQQEGFKPFVRR